MVDVVKSISTMYNFKWTFKKYHTDEWISTPKGGNWSDPTATFTGVFGNDFKLIIHNHLRKRVKHFLLSKLIWVYIHICL